MSTARAALTVGARTVGPVGFGLMGKYSVVYFLQGTEVKTRALACMRERQVDAAFSRDDAAVGTCRLCHRNKGHEDGSRARCQSLEWC